MKLLLISLALGVSFIAASNSAGSCNCIDGVCSGSGCKREATEEVVEKREAQPYIQSDTRVESSSNKKREEARENPCEFRDSWGNWRPVMGPCRGKREAVEKREAGGSYSCSCSSSSNNGVSSGGCTECRDGSCAAVPSCHGKRQVSEDCHLDSVTGQVVCATDKREAVEKREAQPYIQSDTRVESSSNKKRESRCQYCDSYGHCIWKECRPPIWPGGKREATEEIAERPSFTTDCRYAMGPCRGKREVVEKRELPGCHNCYRMPYKCPRRCYVAYGKRAVVDVKKREAERNCICFGPGNCNLDGRPVANC